MLLSLPTSISTLSLSNASQFLGAHPALVHSVAEHALVHSFFSIVRKGRGKGKRISRAQRRKLTNRRRRWFVDNIVMHHKRLHDKNRQNAIDSIRKKALEKREALKKRTPTFKEALLLDREGPSIWRDKVNLKERSSSARDRIKMRELRAKSRWASLDYQMAEEANN